MGLFDIKNIWVTLYGYPLSYVELLGTVTGFISVVLATRSSILTWPTGLINVVCFFVIFFQVRLYSDMFLQLYFFITSIYGWFNWNKSDQANNEEIKVLSRRQRIVIATVIVFSTLIAGLIVKNIHRILPQLFSMPASYPFIDSFVAVLSVVANLLLAQRKIENWFLWITIDVFSVGLYYQKHVLVISIEYFLFLIIAANGLLLWLKHYNENRTSIR